MQQHTYFMHISARYFSFILGALLLAASTLAFAFSATPPDRNMFSIYVSPRTFTPGTPRTISIYGATTSGPITIDESTLATTGKLILRVTPEFIGRTLEPMVVTYTPRSIGTLRVTLDLPDGSAAEALIESVAVGGRSAVNLDGMWFDPATNGSGISFYHSASTDAVFGTWFMFGRGGWYSLQSLQWLPGGTSLIGIAYAATAATQAPCVGLNCPRPAALSPIGAVSVSVVDQNNLRVEAFDQYGRSAFVSLLKRLAF